MTKIEAFSLLDIRPDVIIQNIKRLGNYTVTINSEEPGYFKINILPDLTAAHKTALTTLINSVGVAVITP